MALELNDKELNDVVGGEIDIRKDEYENIILSADIQFDNNSINNDNGGINNIINGGIIYN